jgi:hypothetical protein
MRFQYRLNIYVYIYLYYTYTTPIYYHRGIAHSDVLVQAEITSEERGVERRVQRGIETLPGRHKLHRIIGNHIMLLLNRFEVYTLNV